jgi:two-component system, sensor histidine kinase and response regulator
MKRETRTAFAIVAAFVVLIGVMVGYNAYETDRERPTALVVDVTARQRTLTERYIKDTVLALDGVQADPKASAEILLETATALLEGGEVVTPQGSLDQRVRIPAATDGAVREKLEHERILIRRLLATGARLQKAGSSSPTFAADLRRLRIQGAELSSVTGDAAGEITKDSQSRLSRLVLVEIVLGLLSAAAAVGMALLLRRSALRQSDRFRSLVNNATDLITVLDDNAIARYQSPSSERVLGYNASELVGTKLTDLLHPSDKKHAIEAFAAAMDRPGATIELGFRLRHSDGRWILLEGTATNLLHDRSVRGFVVNSRDVTEREQAAAELSAARDAALSASVTKSQFLASMSHEVRTPMNAIIGLTELLLDTQLESEQHELASGVHGAAEGLLGIINDILDFSKVEAGKLEIEAVPFDLGLVVEDVAVLLGEMANAKGVELLAHCRPEVPTALVGDPTRLRQILLNLGSNAVKFTQRGEVVFRVRLLHDEAARVRLRLEVSDTGVGIAAADLDRLFDPFSQADASTTRRFGGTGLGLAIVKQLVELMDGTLGVESTVDVGSTFWFELALPKQANTVPEHPRIAELADLRVLIVDDNATNRVILREQLGSWGMHTTDAEHAVRALELLHDAAGEGRPYDVVVLDLNMPDIDGLELARAIGADPQIAGPKLFMLSSSGRVSRDVAAAAGLVGTLTKPVRQSELFNCLVAGLSTPADEIVSPIRPEADVAVIRGRVLLVEDNSMNQLVATKLLAKLGYEVAVSGNGIEALQSLADAEYDAVLMDCQMPEMDGYAATREIRNREGGTRRTPVIAMTAAAMQGDREACFAAGMDDYLTKPIRPGALAETLARWVTAGDRTAPATGSEPSPPDDSAPLDPARLSILRDLDDGDGALLASIADEFLAEAQRQLDRLGEALAEGDPQAVEQAAHSIKGSSANLGAIRLADLTGRLEALGRAGALGGASTVCADVSIELERVRVALATVLAAR